MSLEQLRDLLFEEDRARMQQLESELEKIRAKVADKEALIASLNPVIADLLERKIANNGEEMAEIVAPLMGPAIKKQVADSKEEVVEALYPVIGQAVRRAVAEAMRKLAQQVNQRLDKSFQFKTLWLRLRAKLTGIPEPIAVLPQVFPFAIEQLFLIDQRTGLLISHTAANQNGAVNGKTAPATEATGKPQMVSGMLTAIQDFTRDAFGGSATDDLHEVKYGERMIFVASSPPVFLAAVTMGAAPAQFPERLRGLLRRLHNSYHREFREFNGDPTELEKTHEPMRKFISATATTREAPQPTPRPRSGSRHATAGKIALGMALGLGLALAASIWWWPKNPADHTAQTPAATAPIITLTPVKPQLRLEAQFSGRVWLKAITDAADTTEFTFKQGDVYAWHADSLFHLRIGNAGATRLFLDGRYKKIEAQINEPLDVLINAHGLVSVKRDSTWKR